jgi:hypothetical protein
MLDSDADTLILTGSFLTTGSIIVTGSIAVTNGVTGSLLGTASYANNANTASYVLNAVSSSYILNAVSASFASTASYIINASVSGAITNVDYIDFNTSATVTQPVAGRLSWNDSDGTLDLGMKGGTVVQQIGEETFYEVRNQTGTSIPNGTSLYANGVTAGSGRITAAPFVADGTIQEVRYLGLATEDISDGVNGFVSAFGYVRNLDTRGTAPSSVAVGNENWTVGDILYAHPTVPGKLTNIPPKDKVYVAIVIIRNATAGVLFVRPSSYGHIDDLHDVNINTGSLSSGDLLIYDSGSDYWTNSKQLTGSYGLTGSIEATSFTGSLFGTASQAISSSFALTASYALNAGGGGTGGSTTTFTQSVAATTWSFTHNLNTRTPLVQIYDTSYNQIHPQYISSSNGSTVEIGFGISTAGYAVASTGGTLYVTGSNIILNQIAAAATWSFNHGLNTQYPIFQVFNSNDEAIIPAAIKAVSSGSALIYFSTATSGKAVASVGGAISGSGGNAETASHADSGFTFADTLNKYTTVTSSIAGSNNLFTEATSSYRSGFYKYTVYSGSNARTGEVMAVWNGGTINYTETSTTDIGSTNAVTASVSIVSAQAQFNINTSTSGWTVRSTVTYM